MSKVLYELISNQKFKLTETSRLIRQKLFLRVKNGSPECQPLYSDTELYLSTREGRFSADRALATCVALEFICPGEDNYDLREKLDRKLYQLALQYHEGKWLIVKEFYELPFRLRTLHNLVQLWNKADKDSCFFGNHVRLIREQMRSMKVRNLQSPESEKRTPVRKTGFRRGYRDKGTWEPPHRKRIVPDDAGRLQFEFEQSSDILHKQLESILPPSRYYYGRFRKVVKSLTG